ncbi:hypothetical protein EDC96DRAFT_504907 [Choanephora cucurbitarum]|nr:hypothetical protein EDC96DRAFT_504907 [Choanephora cucurbitarum]
MPSNTNPTTKSSMRNIIFCDKRIKKPIRRRKPHHLQNRKPIDKPIEKKGKYDMDDIQSDLDYACDSLASIQVVYDSLKHTYLGCQNKIEQHKANTRLCDMEKELLIAYDDISLQVAHLKKDIARIEKEMDHIKNTVQTDSCSEASSVLSSPASLNTQFLLDDFNLFNYGNKLDEFQPVSYEFMSSVI